MNEKNVRWVDEKCIECQGWVLHDLSHDEKFCENCGLVISNPYFHEVI